MVKIKAFSEGLHMDSSIRSMNVVLNFNKLAHKVIVQTLLIYFHQQRAGKKKILFAVTLAHNEEDTIISTKCCNLHTKATRF